MIITAIILICLILYVIGLTLTPIQLFPEFFFYPWLVSKGLVQYKDFFDHHGFLTNILLSFLAHPSTVQNISFIFICMQIIQCALILKMLVMKIKHPIYNGILFILYLLFQYSIVQQQLWFDTWITFFIVIAWYFFEEDKEILGWIFIASAVMVKPTALLFFVPFYLKSKKKKSIIISFFVWAIPFFYFWGRGALGALWRQLFVFNYSYIQSTYTTLFIGIPIKLLLFISAGFVFLLLYLLKAKKKNIPLILMIAISFSFFLQGFSRLNFAVFVPFCVLGISELVNKKKINKIVAGTIIFFILIMGRETYRTFLDVSKRQVYLSQSVVNETKQIASSISRNKGKNILVVGNRVELYYLLDVLPPEFTPLHFPWVEKMYKKNIDFKNIEYIIVPKKFGEYESLDDIIWKRLSKFSQIGQTASYTIWRYNKK
jgi:hypothetical protein